MLQQPMLAAIMYPMLWGEGAAPHPSSSPDQPKTYPGTCCDFMGANVLISSRGDGEENGDCAFQTRIYLNLTGG